jgi:hypothetical protein
MGPGTCARGDFMLGGKVACNCFPERDWMT